MDRNRILIYAAMIAGGAGITLSLLALALTLRPTDVPEASADDARVQRVAALADQWPEAPAHGDHFNALDPLLGKATATSRVQFDPSDDYWGLPRNEGYELVDAYCSACHTLQIVMQQSATRERWDDMLDWMVEEQGMAPMPQEDREIVLTYLSQTFATTQP